MADLELDSPVVAGELEAAVAAIERGEMVMLSPDVAACLIDAARAESPGVGAVDGLRARLIAALDAIEGQARGFKTLQYRQGWLDAIQSLRAEVALPDDMTAWSAATPPSPVTSPDGLRERLAAIEHEQWMAWSQDLMSKELLTGDRIARWQSLWVPYAELSEEMKDHDREWADKVLAALENGEQGPDTGAGE